MKNLEKTVYTIIPSPVGDLTLVANDKALCAVIFSTKTPKSFLKNDKHPILKLAAIQLKEYFEGRRKDFALPLSPEGTAFQQKAWKALQSIPYGKTITYQAQATHLGDQKKARAVGTANSQNPLCIIVPCHRVIAKSGKISGYIGGVSVKDFLLTHEQKYIK